jgi:hypothetical protein
MLQHTSNFDRENSNKNINKLKITMRLKRHLPWWILAMILILVTFMTGSPLQQTNPYLSQGIKLSGYILVLGTTVWLGISHMPWTNENIRGFLHAYRSTILFPLLLYFVGLLIGAFNGPATLYSLWQTFSDFVVFVFAFLAYGWLVSDIDRAIYQFLRVLVSWAVILMTTSLVIYIGNLNGWWEINAIPFRTILLMNGPFNHANHLGYTLMTGAFAAACMFMVSQNKNNKLWLILTIYLTLGVAITFARGAMIGTAVGLIGIISIRYRRIALALGILAIITLIVFTVVAALKLPFFDFLPKTDFSQRGIVWGMALKKLVEYGPLGVGSGQAESFPNLTMHSFWLEQYGEGGVITTIGILGWFILPIMNIKRSRLNPKLIWSIVAMMAGLMVHGVFWGYFLNGLRLLSLIYICLWTALATVRKETTQTSCT